jgi:hypothetical protein
MMDAVMNTTLPHSYGSRDKLLDTASKAHTQRLQGRQESKDVADVRSRRIDVAERAATMGSRKPLNAPHTGAKSRQAPEIQTAPSSQPMEYA